MRGKMGNGFFQNAWIVADIDVAMNTWVSQGVGPFYVFRHAIVGDYLYRGQPSSIDFSAALAQSGSIQIELIQQHDGRPSQYNDSFGLGESGFHHMCRFTEDFDADLIAFADGGSAIAGIGLSGDMRFAYIDTRSTIGCMTEIIERKASIVGLFEAVSKAAVAWDGRDPVRELK